AKPSSAVDPANWSEWQELDASQVVALGRPRFNGKDVSIHGVYRFQLRVSVPPGDDGARASGLESIHLNLLFENGIMSLPRLQPGTNAMRFELASADTLTGPVYVTYRFATADGEREHAQTIRREDFTGNVARYTLDAPGLVRCNSVEIRY
ncbi:MAG TPA: hypothetical protein VES20_22760, partial [Bryobacteraceae bacterium]|nr:hypothetical protein [Bryobacteraceae bacterium]